MKVWVLEYWDYASCGEHTECEEYWIFTTKEKAEEFQAVRVAQEVKGWLLNGPTEKQVNQKYHINQVEVL